MSEENMKLWNEVCTTDDRYVKKMDFSTLSSINAHYQIKEATKLWGSYGNKWGVRNIKYEIINDFALCQAEFYYPDGAFDINSDIEVIFRTGKRQGKYNEDWSKKVVTDALTKGLSKLGFSADVFLNEFHDNKYSKSQSKPQTTQPFKEPQQLDAIMSGDLSDDETKQKAKSLVRNSNLSETEKEKELININDKPVAYSKYIINKYSGGN